MVEYWVQLDNIIRSPETGTRADAPGTLHNFFHSLSGSLAYSLIQPHNFQPFQRRPVTLECCGIAPAAGAEDAGRPPGASPVLHCTVLSEGFAAKTAALCSAGR